MPFDGTNSKQDDVLDLLRRARKRIARPGGWCKGVSPRGNRVCVLGSIWVECFYEAASEIPSLLMKFDKLSRLLKEELPDGFDHIPNFNDAEGRTQAEIVALFDRAIAKMEAGE